MLCRRSSDPQRSTGRCTWLSLRLLASRGCLCSRPGSSTAGEGRAWLPMSPDVSLFPGRTDRENLENRQLKGNGKNQQYIGKDLQASRCAGNHAVGLVCAHTTLRAAHAGCLYNKAHSPGPARSSFVAGRFGGAWWGGAALPISFFTTRLAPRAHCTLIARPWPCYPSRGRHACRVRRSPRRPGLSSAAVARRVACRRTSRP